MNEKNPLKTYREKRRFEITPEPRGEKETSGSQPVFVVQKHQASHLHYDFRLEAGGVLKSWAVPKGPPAKPGERRLAVPTEDHPLEYASFEGTIPEGQYGAGTVEIWDSGTYLNLQVREGQEIPPGQAIEEGHFKFYLEGKRLKGSYALTRTGAGREERWLLVKMKEDHP